MSLRHRTEAWHELLKRYRATWRHFWAHRHQLSQPPLTAHEAEFLPAALSLPAQPVSPAGRWVARVLIGLIVVLLLWATLGQLDIIVNGQGKIIPSERTKTIAAIEVGSVRAVHVKEGQAVKAGERLIELDTRASDSDYDKALGEQQTAQLQAARSRALLVALQDGRPPILPAMPEVRAGRWQEAKLHLHDQWQDFVARRQRLDGEIQRYGEALPLATKRASDYAELARTRDVAEHVWTEKEQLRIELEGQLNDARNQKSTLLAETRKNAQDILNEALRMISAFSQEARRASVRSELLTLRSPVDGTVQQLAVHTTGTAVPAAQALMQIVPRQSQLEIEAFIENKDVGFVQEGQAAAVRLDAFDYTRYGTIPATVVHISRDAIPDEKRGPIYAVKIALARSTIVVKGREAALAPGMSGSVEIKTGTRRIIEYVLSPLIQHGRESLHER